MSPRRPDLVTNARRAPHARHISPALHGESVLAALRNQGVELLFGADKPVACFVDRVHFGSRIGVVIDYTVRLSRSGGQTADVRLFGQLPWSDAGATAARAERKLSRQANATDAGGAAPNVVLIPDWGLLLRRPGHDERLSGLWLLQPRRHWSKHVVDDDSAALARDFDRATLLTHRFAKRAVLRLERTRDDQGRTSAIAKFYRGGSTAVEASACIHRDLGAAFSPFGADVAVPRVVAVLPEMSGILMQDVAGVPLSELADGARAAGMASAGLALARLHSASLAGLAEYGVAEELLLLREWVEFISNLDPQVGPAFGAKLHDVAQAFSRCVSPRLRPIHRDFHERQLLCSAGSATLIDFDTIRLGDPAQDLGNFLAHLKFAAQLTGTPSDDARTTFLHEYERAASDAVGLTNILAHEQATLLRLALINWFNERRRDAANALLDGL